ncbi:MAG: response regulator [Pseudomonadota bacterium]
MKKILIIDDEPQIRSMLKMLFEREGFHVVVACDGKEGTRLFEQDPADLVITDLIMPEKEGVETIRELRKKNPVLPIVAMSGGGRSAPDGYLHMAKLLGANAVFKKPIAKEDLLKIVRDLGLERDDQARV